MISAVLLLLGGLVALALLGYLRGTLGSTVHELAT